MRETQKPGSKKKAVLVVAIVHEAGKEEGRADSVFGQCVRERERGDCLFAASLYVFASERETER